MRTSLKIWKAVINRNRGLSYSFILGELPHAPYAIFVDAASSSGIGGVMNDTYFTTLNCILRVHLKKTPGWEKFPRVPIAWTELLAVFVALSLFGHKHPRTLLVLYSDNTNVVSWLGRRRSPDPHVCTLVSAIERIKYTHSIKLTVKYIPSNVNSTADRLSRNCTPKWLYVRGKRIHPNFRELFRELNHSNMYAYWQTTLTKA